MAAKTKKNVVIGWSETEGTAAFKKVLKDIFLAVPGLTDNRHIRYLTSKADIDEAVYSGKCDILFLSEVINGTPVGKGEIRKYLANGADGINVLLVVSDDKKGAGKLKGLFGYGYYNAIYKKDCTPDNIEALTEKPRTEAEAYDYYGLASFRDPLDEKGDRLPSDGPVAPAAAEKRPTTEKAVKTEKAEKLSGKPAPSRKKPVENEEASAKKEAPAADRASNVKTAGEKRETGGESLSGKRKDEILSSFLPKNAAGGLVEPVVDKGHKDTYSKTAEPVKGKNGASRTDNTDDAVPYDEDAENAAHEASGPFSDEEAAPLDAEGVSAEDVPSSEMDMSVDATSAEDASVSEESGRTVKEQEAAAGEDEGEEAIQFPKETSVHGEVFKWSPEEIEDYLSESDRDKAQPKAAPIVLTEVDNIVEAVLKHYTKEDPAVMSNLEKHLIDRKSFEKDVQNYMTRTFKASSAVMRDAYNNFLQYMFSYDVITPLIEDPLVSDIKIYTPDNIRVKRKGKRLEAKEKFRSDAHYRAFVSHIARLNNVSINSGEDIVHFSDTDTFEDYRLRVNISTEFINSTNLPCMQIRKESNQKRTTEYLVNNHMFSPRTAAFLINAAKSDVGIIFTGKGSAGKTTCMNWLVDYIPRDCSGICIQESDELFSDVHPDILFQRIAEDKTSGEVYDLERLSINALLIDVDYFIIGEIKGGEARYFLNAAYTGNRCWASVHSPSSQDALTKIADYATYDSDYTKDELLQMLASSPKVVVFLKNFHVAEISVTCGWDYDRHCVKYERIPLD